nr:AP2-like ethylene-responsive transcription factor BBM [Paeonia ostii]
MGSMNNWLAFSLSPQEPHQDHSHNTVSRLGFHSDEISGNDVSGECFDLTSDATPHSLNLPPPFGILEAFNRNNQTHDWNMNSEANYKSTSDFSMLMSSSCSESQEPKLENFLGGHSFADHEQKLSRCNSTYTTTGDYMTFPDCSLQLPSEPATAVETTNGRSGSGGLNNNNNTSSSIGLSMIKTWLRNQPAPPPPQPENMTSDGAAPPLTSAQSLSLSMSTGSQSQSNGAGGSGREREISSSDNNKQQKATAMDSQTGAIEAVPRKSIDTFGQRTSIYRGVTRHRWTGRYEAHLWDNSCRREGQTRKGRQVYLGGYDKEEKAARAYDLAALKYWGTTTTTNFPITNYEKEVEEMTNMTRQEYVASLRRKSSGFSRGASIYRGVTRHHQHGRWQARIGRVAGNKDLYLGTFSTQEEAAEAYDIAAIKFRGLNAVTNFDMSRYDVKSILESSTLPIGGAAKRLKDAEAQAEMTVSTDDDNTSSQLTDGINNYGTSAHHHHSWPTIAFQQPQPFSMHYPYGTTQQRIWCKQEQDADPNNNHHNFQDLHQLQLGNTHNFFQPSVLHNLMSLDSSSMEHSSGSNNSVMYSNGGGGDGNGGGSGYGSISGGYVVPMGTVMGHDEGSHSFGDQNEVKPLGYAENMYGSSTDPYHARNLYYLSQQSSNAGMVRAASVYDQGSTCNNSWVPTAIPTLAPRTNNTMAVCHGAPTFTVWNDT